MATVSYIGYVHVVNNKKDVNDYIKHAVLLFLTNTVIIITMWIINLG